MHIFRVQLYGAIQKTLFQGCNVALVQPLGEPQANPRNEYRQSESSGDDDARTQEQQPNQPSSDEVSEAVESDINQRLCDTLFPRRNGSVKDFVSGTKERV